MVILRPKGQWFKSWLRQPGLLLSQIPVDSHKIELTQIIQACVALARLFLPDDVILARSDILKLEEEHHFEPMTIN